MNAQTQRRAEFSTRGALPFNQSTMFALQIEGAVGRMGVKNDTVVRTVNSVDQY